MPNVDRNISVDFINTIVGIQNMDLIIIVGMLIAVITVFVAMVRAGGDIRWGITSGLGVAMLLIILIAWAQSTGLL